MTNFDVIKQMTVVELGKFLSLTDCANCVYQERCEDTDHCKDGITKWLEREADWWMSDYIKENNV